MKSALNKNAFSLVEMAITISVVAVGLSGFIYFQSGYLKSKRILTERTAAQQKAASKLVELMNRSFENPELSNGTHSEAPPGSLSWEVETLPSSPRLKKITVTEPSDTGQSTLVSGIKYNDF